MKRTFIAIDIPAGNDLKILYSQIREQLRGEKINWIPDNNLHITLKFLGDTDEQILPAIKDEIGIIASSASSINLELKGLGVFKNIRDPRVFWIGCQADEKLITMAAELNTNLKQYGFEPERTKFSPHLTLGRIKEIHHKELLEKLIALNKNTLFQKQDIGEIVFYESRLTTAGSIYTPLGKFKLPL